MGNPHPSLRVQAFDPYSDRLQKGEKIKQDDILLQEGFFLHLFLSFPHLKFWDRLLTRAKHQVPPLPRPLPMRQAHCIAKSRTSSVYTTAPFAPICALKIARNRNYLYGEYRLQTMVSSIFSSIMDELEKRGYSCNLAFIPGCHAFLPSLLKWEYHDRFGHQDDISDESAAYTMEYIRPFERSYLRYLVKRNLEPYVQSQALSGAPIRQATFKLCADALRPQKDSQSYQLIFINKSGCDKRTGHRRYGWASVGITPIQVARFSREQRFQVLAAYTQNGVKLARVYSGLTDANTYENFLKQLLYHYGRWPDPNSVLVMDNASIHH